MKKLWAAGKARGLIAVMLACFAWGTATGMASRENLTELLVFIGTYTRGESKGIYIYKMDLNSGGLTPVGVRDAGPNPSFLAVHPNHRFLYAVNEIAEYEGEKTGSITAFSLDPTTGVLDFLNRQSSSGAIPCHLVVDAAGKNVLLANYVGGNVSVLPIQNGGRLGRATSVRQHEGSSIHPSRQTGPRAHSINLDQANRFAVAADLGIDRVLVYRFDGASGELTPNDPPSVSVKPGAGPRHFAFHPSQPYAYVINELDSTITAFTYDSKLGTLESMQTLSTLPEGFEGVTHTAEVQVHPSGRFVYGSNRGHDSIAMFRVDATSGRLSPIGHEPTGGKTPRNFGIDPSGRYLIAANQDSDSLVVFRIDPEAGSLQSTGIVVDVPAPVCVKMIPRQ